MANYFNQLSFRNQIKQLSKCRFMDKSEFENSLLFLESKKIVIVGCGAQGLNQGLNMRDSGLDVSYALRKSSIDAKNKSYLNASENGFKVGTYEELIPLADLVINLTPDKQHSKVVDDVMPLMKKNSALGYSHGFNIVEEGKEIRKDITVVMVAPKCPGTEVREEYKRGFGVPTLIAVHPENDVKGEGIYYAKAWAASTGGHRAGVLESSFVAEVKSDLMGEQTILCGMLQAGSILCYDKMVASDISPTYAGKLIQNGWEQISEALKLGGITHMMNRLSNESKLKANELSKELKTVLTPLYKKHMDNILSGYFATNMMKDWNNNDQELLDWRSNSLESGFENYPDDQLNIKEQEYFDHGVLMVAMVKAGVELAFEVMVEAGIKEESAYYESLHELPLIANTIARKRLYEMNIVISDTAEYGNYLFANEAVPLLAKEFMNKINTDVIGSRYVAPHPPSNIEIIHLNKNIAEHPIELIGKKLRSHMTDMKSI